MTEQTTFEYTHDDRKLKVNISEDMREYLLKQHEPDDVERAVLQMCKELTESMGFLISDDIKEITFEMHGDNFRTYLD